MSADTPKPASRRIFWLLGLLFFAPLAVAFLMYYGGGPAWRPAGHTNHGVLIQPPRPLPSVVLLNAEDQQLEADFLHGKWTLAYIGDGACDARCRTALVAMRQVRLALNKDATRVQRVFFVPHGCCDQPY